jgi:hypothetical protein
MKTGANLRLPAGAWAALAFLCLLLCLGTGACVHTEAHGQHDVAIGGVRR